MLSNTNFLNSHKEPLEMIWKHTCKIRCIVLIIFKKLFKQIHRKYSQYVSTAKKKSLSLFCLKILWKLKMHACILSCFSHVQLFATLWTVACQDPLSMGFSRQEFRSGLLCHPPGESSWPRDQTQVSYVSCIGKWILYH